MFSASNPGEQSELSLLTGSLIGFLHLCKLGYHPLGRFPAHCSRVKPSLWWPSVTPFSRESGCSSLPTPSFIPREPCRPPQALTNLGQLLELHLAPLLIPASSQGSLPGLGALMDNGLMDGETPAFQLHGSFQDHRDLQDVLSGSL